MHLCALEDYRRRYPERQTAMRLVNRAIEPRHPEPPGAE